MVYQKGYHLGYQRNNNTMYERGSKAGYSSTTTSSGNGSHADYQVNNNVVHERGYHLQNERNDNVIFERSKGMTTSN